MVLGGVGKYQNIAAAPGVGNNTRILNDGAQVQTAQRGFQGKALAAFDGTLMSTQNRATLNDFRAAVIERFGQNTGSAAFDHFLGNKLTNGRSLLKSDIQAVLNMAQTAENLTLGNAAAPQATKDDLMARKALANIQFADPQRAEMLKPLLLPSLTAMAQQVSAIDQSANGDVLASIGTKLAKTLDEKFLLTMLGTELTAAPYNNAGSAEDLTRQFVQDHGNPQSALAAMLTKYPAVSDAILIEMQQVETNMNQIATRMTADLAQINLDFANAWPPGTAPATGLTDIIVTSSDPHHGGNRVCILELDNGEKIVYKPRDVRIDAKLAGHVGAAAHNPAIGPGGDGARSLLEMGNVLLENHLGAAPADPMETYQFLPRQDPGGDRYGYVEFLSHGTQADNSMTRAEAQVFARNLGRELALMNLLGVRDMHQSNMMVSGKQPMFSDLEICFDTDVLGLVQTDLTNPNPGGGIAHLMTSQLTGLFSNVTEVVRVPNRFEIDNAGQFAQTNGTKTEVVIENFIHISNPQANETEHNRAGGDNVLQPYAADFAAGYLEMMQAIASNPGTVTRMQNFVDTCAGMHVRHHPISTGAQLEVLQQTARTRNVAPPAPPNQHTTTADVTNSVRGAVQANIATRGTPNLQHTENAQVADQMRGDVPYFSRELALPGAANEHKIFHNAAAPIVTNAAAGGHAQHAYFNTNPMTDARNLIGLLAPVGGGPSPTMTNIQNVFVPKYQNYIANLQQQPLIGNELQDFRNDFPNVAHLV